MGMLPVLIVGIALLVFLWKLMRQMTGGMGGSIDAKSLRSSILVGIVILFAMVSVWGIVVLIQSVFFPGAVLTKPSL